MRKACSILELTAVAAAVDFSKLLFHESGFGNPSSWQDNSPDPAHQLTKTFSLNPKSITMEDARVFEC